MRRPYPAFAGNAPGNEFAVFVKPDRRLEREELEGDTLGVLEVLGRECLRHQVAVDVRLGGVLMYRFFDEVFIGMNPSAAPGGMQRYDFLLVVVAVSELCVAGCPNAAVFEKGFGVVLRIGQRQAVEGNADVAGVGLISDMDLVAEIGAVNEREY